ncbi:lysophospholipid acyltransferase family protein [bacterium]
MRLKQRIIRYLIYIFTRLFSYFVLILPYSTAVWLGGVLGFLSGKILHSARHMVLENLSLAFPDKTKQELNKITSKMFEHLGKSLFEFLWSPRFTKKFLDSIVETQGFEHIDKALEQGKGVIFLASHTGNWELMAMNVALSGYPVYVVAKRIYDDRLNDILVSYRESKGVMSILRTESTKIIVKALNNSETVGMLIDQDTKVKGCFVDFFGHRAYTASAPAVLALKYNVDVLPVFITRINNSKHKMIVHPRVDINVTGDHQKDIIENTQKFNNIIEQAIRKCPSQWVWIHKRWKTKEF